MAHDGAAQHRARPVGRVEQPCEHREVVADVGGEGSDEPQKLSGGLERVDHQTSSHDRAHRMEPVLERGDYPEVRAGAPHAPEEIRVLVLARGEDTSVRGDDLDGEQVVGREAVSTHQVAEAATERVTGDAGRGHRPAGDGEAVKLGLPIQLSPRDAGLRSCCPRRRIDVDPPHRTQVDHQATVGHGLACNVVPAPTHRELEPLLARHVDGSRHIGCATTARNDRRPLVDQTVMDATGVFVTRVVRPEELAAEPFERSQVDLG